MRHALTSFLALPRITVRRMMSYVAASALALHAMITLPPYINAVRVHWAVCHAHAARYSNQAADCRRLSTLYPGDTPIPDLSVCVQTLEVQRTGSMALKDALHCEALAKIYERAKWRPWAGLPTDPSPRRPEP